MKTKIKIIYEDDDLVVIDKPSGISVHGDGRTDEYTVADWVLEKYPEISEVGEQMLLPDGKIIKRPGIVHRLDKDTSGVMVIAKTDFSYKNLKSQFQDREISKVYRAIVFGKFKDNNGFIDKPIGKSANDFRAKSTGSRAKGEKRSAITYYKILERFGDFTLLELRPKTGRTHQIRVHLKSISRPIVCDSLYAKEKPCPSFMGRLALHAYSIEIFMPGGGKKLFISEMPKDILSALDKIKAL